MSEKTKEEMEYEERLRRRLKVLQEQMTQGKVKIAEELKVVDSLNAVRVGPDGEVDLDTVDGLVRSMALGVTAMHDREELKKLASLSEVQTSYFNFFEQNFGHFYELMLKRKLTPHDAGRAAMQSEGSIREITEHLDKLLEFIEEFWSELGEIAHAHVEDQHNNIKGVFGGDLFPAHDENIASKCGIYTDTIILPDPFLRSKHIFQNSKPADQAYYIIKHAMNILQYKQLACAEVDIPIVVVLPDITAIKSEEREFVHKLGLADSLKHSGKLFGRKFESIEELLEFTHELDTIERAIAAIDDKSRLLFDTEWQGDIASQLERAINSPQSELIGTKNPGVILANQAVGRMSVSNELLIKSRRLRGSPLVDAPTSWQYLAWKMEYDALDAEIATHTKDLHITRGLQGLSDGDMQWLGRVPPDALIEVRKQGALDEIRGILGKGVQELTSSNPNNFHRTRDQIFDNINEAFENHKANIKDLRAKNWKFAGSDIGSWLVTGTLGITAAATGSPIWALAAIGADQILGAPKLKELPSSIKELVEENKKVNMSPVGMLFNVKKRLNK
ncbi:hypothetical protein CWC26_02955 [Pseudoalteromonas sp. S4488]|uniref:hypothetical protein n=1 Tax=unclassified Pseudoalteromonas TaxID=194690 RepID=UPI0010230208|nr:MULTISPECIES: hypothetical protein [unclassified Pseudoalteromonas]RZF78640.1 hypothetical protein EXT43_17240 [Pseudoalteromonas sp. CO109Y]TMO35213.1 hypothetical protein CWC27_11645 [Pseudoalteromonas sp. S4491]TMO41087.1 hypothetical protein CWC26_02955 [Pseudoalteromonas sp. S4488]